MGQREEWKLREEEGVKRVAEEIGLDWCWRKL